jgi:squalene synthase HpnC
VPTPHTTVADSAAGARRLQRARAHCRRTALGHYENFPVGSWLLPGRLRPAVHAIYAFARGADDFADEPQHEGRRLAALDQWETWLERAAAGEAEHPVFCALAEALRRHRLPLQPFRDLLTAFRMDASGTRYRRWEELLGYCRFSADPVGRLMLRLFGHDDARLDALSDALCTALQLTNFWQDLGIDLPRGRLYLPAEDLQRFGLTDSDVAAGSGDSRLRDLLAHEVARTRELFASARELPSRLAPPLSWEVRAIAAGGGRILDRLEADGFDPLARRPRLGWGDRLAIAWAALVPRRAEANA